MKLEAGLCSVLEDVTDDEAGEAVDVVSGAAHQDFTIDVSVASG